MISDADLAEIQSSNKLLRALLETQAVTAAVAAAAIATVAAPQTLPKAKSAPAPKRRLPVEKAKAKKARQRR